MNLREANGLALELMKEHGLIQAGWHFKFDRGVKRFGICRYSPKVIGLSKKLTEANGEIAVRLTILHEIAHALVGPGHHHDHVWRQKCLEVGGNGRRYYSGDTVEAVVQRYRATCGRCGRVSYMGRRPKVSRSCGTCSKRYNPDLVLTVTDTRTGRDVTVTPSRGLEWAFSSLPGIPIVDVLIAANTSTPAPQQRGGTSLKRVDSHEWQTRDGRTRFVRGWADTSERTWSIIDAATGAVRDETFPTLRAAKEAM